VKISVVVPAFNEEKLITESLRHINAAREAIAESGWESELIVCDNNSTDRTAELAREAGATVVFEAINQIGRARNTGAAAAQGDWLVFVDADSHPDATLLGALADRIESGRWIGGGCRVAMDRPLRWRWRAWVHAWNLISRWMKLAAGSFLACDASAFREVGGFDDRFFAGEEVDLSIRLKKVGRKRGRRFFILKEVLTTSSRKVNLYSGREILGLLTRIVRLGPTGFQTNRDACGFWYDGRR